MPAPTPAGQPRGVVRLLNTSGGGALCLAGEVDTAAVEAFHRRYGREPARVAVIDAGSVTALSAAALDLVLDHLDAAERAGRPVRVRRSPVVERLLAEGPLAEGPLAEGPAAEGPAAEGTAAEGS